MGGTDIATVAHAFKGAFVDATTTLVAATSGFESVSVVFGRPTSFLEADIVAFTRLSSDQAPATFGTNRGREEVLELDVIISAAIPGGQSSDREASDRAYDILRLIERYARITDTTIGGTVRECFLDRHDSDGVTGQQVAATSRNIIINATFQAKVRISA